MGPFFLLKSRHACDGPSPHPPLAPVRSSPPAPSPLPRPARCSGGVPQEAPGRRQFHAFRVRIFRYVWRPPPAVSGGVPGAGSSCALSFSGGGCLEMRERAARPESMAARAAETRGFGTRGMMCGEE